MWLTNQPVKLEKKFSSVKRSKTLNHTIKKMFSHKRKDIERVCFLIRERIKFDIKNNWIVLTSAAHTQKLE